MPKVLYIQNNSSKIAPTENMNSKFEKKQNSMEKLLYGEYIGGKFVHFLFWFVPSSSSPDNLLLLLLVDHLF